MDSLCFLILLSCVSLLEGLEVPASKELDNVGILSNKETSLAFYTNKDMPHNVLTVAMDMANVLNESMFITYMLNNRSAEILTKLATAEKSLFYEWIEKECGRCANCVLQIRPKRFIIETLAVVGVAGVSFTWLFVQQIQVNEVKSRLKEVEDTAVTYRDFYKYMTVGQKNLDDLIESLLKNDLRNILRAERKTTELAISSMLQTGKMTQSFFPQDQVTQAIQSQYSPQFPFEWTPYAHNLNFFYDLADVSLVGFKDNQITLQIYYPAFTLSKFVPLSIHSIIDRGELSPDGSQFAFYELPSIVVGSNGSYTPINLQECKILPKSNAYECLESGLPKLPQKLTEYSLKVLEVEEEFVFERRFKSFTLVGTNRKVYDGVMVPRTGVLVFQKTNSTILILEHSDKMLFDFPNTKVFDLWSDGKHYFNKATGQPLKFRMARREEESTNFLSTGFFWGGVGMGMLILFISLYKCSECFRKIFWNPTQNQESQQKIPTAPSAPSTGFSSNPAVVVNVTQARDP